MGCVCTSQPWESKNAWLFLYLPLPPDFLMYFREGWGLCKHRCNFRECPEVLSINRRCQGDRCAWSLPLLGEDWEGTWCMVNCHEHRPRGCPPHTRAAAAAATALLLSSWNVALQKYHRWGTRPLPNTRTAFRKNSQHPLIFHPLSDINAIPHLRVQTLNHTSLWNCTELSQYCFATWYTAASHFQMHSCTSVHFQGFCPLSYSMRAMLSPSTFSKKGAKVGEKRQQREVSHPPWERVI